MFSKKYQLLENWKRETKYCKSLFSKFRGLMFSKKKILIFINKKEEFVSLHMFFVFFPIYVYFFNNKKQLIKTKRLYPFISFMSGKAKYIIESPYKLNRPNSYL